MIKVKLFARIISIFTDCIFFIKKNGLLAIDLLVHGIDHALVLELGIVALHFERRREDVIGRPWLAL